jgi:hypothetical protein
MRLIDMTLGLSTLGDGHFLDLSPVTDLLETSSVASSAPQARSARSGDLTDDSHDECSS